MVRRASLASTLPFHRDGVVKAMIDFLGE